MFYNSQTPWCVAHFHEIGSDIVFPGEQVLIFSQWTKILDIMDYYFSEKGFEVCRIDGSVKLEERRRQVCPVLVLLLHCNNIRTI